MSQELKEELAQKMAAARSETLRLFDLAREEHLHASPGFGFRPIIWHLAHIGVFEAYWLLQKMQGETAPDERYERIFDPINTPREESKNLPTRAEMEGFLTGARGRVVDYLERAQFDETAPLLRDGYIFQLVLEHEYQHQETLCYLLHMLEPKLKTRPAPEGSLESKAVSDVVSGQEPEMMLVEAGEFEMGAVWDSFAYDNERPAHTVSLPAFKIDRLLTTNEEYAQFIREGGYERREWWSEEGWQWREKENWRCPLYWQQEGEEWRERTMFAESIWQPTHPVTGLSWYEAEAYARFMGKRLPTEAEWEKAASWDAVEKRKRRFAWGDEVPTSALANFQGERWDTTPVGSFPAGASGYGCLDMTGNVWEWTSTSFAGYEGFEYFPYPEYSQIWFDGDHRVLKGGSWATRAPLLRTSFRNFFRRHFRIAFAGLRLAADV